MPRDTSRLHLAVLVPHLRHRRGTASAAIAAVLGTVALDLTVPVLLARFVDGALEAAPLDDLLRIAGAFLAASVGTQVLSAASTYLGTKVGWGVANDLRVVSAGHVLALDMDHHTATNPGALIERVDGDITAVAQFFSHFATKVLAAVLLLGGIIVVSFTENPVAGWTVLAFAVVVGLALWGTRAFAVGAADAERGVSGRLFGFIEEHLGAIDDLRANGGGEPAMERSRAVMAEYAEIGVRSWMRRSVIWVTSIGLFSLSSLIALAVGSTLALSGSITIGTAILIYQYMTKLEAPIEEITNQTQELQKAAAGLARLGRLLATQPSVSRRGSVRLPEGPLAIDVVDVDFAYEEAPVLVGVDLRIPSGTSVGLLGRTGSGKSTLVKLLARIADPASGSVSLGGVDLRDADPADVSRRVATVPQEVHLFSGTVAQNVTLFADGVDDRLVRTALEEIGLGGWLDALPSGIHTVIGPEGIGLSSGEAQLLAFARAYLRDPGLVILDEPSSRVDPATEALLSSAIRRLVAGRTAIVIAHRLETVKAVDRIVVLSGGRVVEDGPRTDLAANPRSRFAAMLAASGEGATIDDLVEVLT